jgi:cytochrome c6
MKRSIALAAVTTLALAVALPAALAEEGAAGQELFEKKCAMCHGKDGVAKSMAKGSANLNDAEWQKGTSAEAIAALTTEGKGKMPSYKDKLSADEIKAISEYILTLK